MSEVEMFRKGFVAFLDGLWWGLRDNTGALSMYEGYSEGFRQMGQELAESMGGKGPERAAEIAGEILKTIGLEVEVENKAITVKSCPIWDRILQKGLEFSFHIEEICWKPLLEGIAQVTNAKPKVDSSLRLIHINKEKVEYKKGKAKKALEKGDLTKEEYEKQIVMLDKDIESIPKFGHYRFE